MSGRGVRILARFAAFVVAVAVVLPLLLFADYDAFVFQPHRAEIRALASPYNSGQRALPVAVTVLLQQAFRGRKASSNVARLLIWRLRIPYLMKGALGWQLTYALWTALVYLHLPEQEQFALIAAHAYTGNGHYGFAAEARARFGKPLAQLSLSEAATVVALMFSPGSDHVDPDRLAARRDWLLAGLKTVPAHAQPELSGKGGR